MESANFRFIKVALIVSTLVSCSKVEINDNGITVAEVVESKVFYAATPKDTLSKAYIDSDLNILWTEDDRLSVFRGSSNEQYRYTGQSGQNEGRFEKVGGDAPASFYSHNYGIYPYSAGNSSVKEGTVNLTLPATQYYAVNSFGLAANTMAAVTATADGNSFKFKNVCGYLLLKVYGGDIIRSIVFRGNNNEKIAGTAALAASYSEAPTIVMTDLSTTEITLDCGDEGVATGATKDECTSFWIVVPPTTFTGGFTVEIANIDGQTVTKSTSKSMSITRNVIQPMAAVKVDYMAHNDLLSFSLSDGINSYEAFDISNGYVNVQVPNGTEMTKMTATFTHNGAKVTVNSEEQTSGEGTRDFSDFVNPLTYVVTSQSGEDNSYIIRLFDLPVVIATTPEGTPITSKEVWTENCTFVIREADGTVTDYGSTSLKGRGNASWDVKKYGRKKPYAVKFGTKNEVLGMPTHKRWCLLTDPPGYYYSNTIGFELGKRTAALAWTPDSRYVELFMNGEHQGLYTLTEQIKVDGNRVDITEMTSSDIDDESVTGGYLLSYDTTMDEINTFYSQYYNMPVMIKEPDEDVLVTAQFNYIQSYINNFEASLNDDTRFASREYLKYFDINSYIDMWFVWEMAGPIHILSDTFTDFAQPRSVYFHKDRNDVIRSGPLWDFNTSLFYHQVILCDKCQYYGRLFQDGYFVDKLKTKWPEFKSRVKGESGGYQSIVGFLDDIHNSIDKASERDWNKWWKDKPAHVKFVEEPEVQYTLIRNGIYPKLDFLESYINSLTVDYDDKSGGNEDYGNQDDQSGNFNFETK